MSVMRTIPRLALDTYLRAVRWPIDRATALLPGNGQGPAAGAKLAVDRVDAGVRAAAGRMIGDEELVEDATRRRAAADERERALRLRGQAEQTEQEAEQRQAQREEQAEQRRRQATRRASQRRQSTEQQTEQQKRRTKTAEQRRKQANAKATAQAKEQAQSRARRARLEALEEESEALETRDDALEASDEAQRLQKAAAQAKAERKGD
jgi:hypothetical protein